MVDNRTNNAKAIISSLRSTVGENIRVFRRIPVRIMGAFTEPVQPYMIEPKITELLLENEKRKETMNPIERIARFHLEFEGIHPFIDGNGRTGRLILNLELIKAGLLPVNIKFADRRRYYDSFDAYFGEEHSPHALAGLLADYEIAELEKRLAILAGE